METGAREKGREMRVGRKRVRVRVGPKRRERLW